jgi:hypothetical protein
MPSSWSASLRFELQFTGENINLWGDKLNAVLTHVDYGVAGWLTKALTGNYSLTTANAGDDEARAAMLRFTGAGPFDVTIPSVSKAYDVWNACSALLVIKTGSGSTSVIQPGEVMRVICDGANVKRVVPTDFGGHAITGVADPTNPQDAATKAYIDAVTFATNAGILPGQPGNAGGALFTNGTTPAWRFIAPSDIGGFAASVGQIWTGTTVASAATPGGIFQSLAEVALPVVASVVSPDMTTFTNGLISPVGNFTLANPTGVVPGKSGRIRIVQDATGSRTMAMGSNWKRVGGAIALTTTANATDFIEYDAVSATYILYNLLRNPS